MFVEPAAPKSSTIPCACGEVAGFNQGEVATSAGVRMAGWLLSSHGLRHRRELFAKRTHRRGRMLTTAVAQGQATIGHVQVHGLVRRINADVDVGVVALEGLQPRDQPSTQGRKGWCGDTLLRPLWRIWRTAPSIRSRAWLTAISSWAPALVSSTARVWRRNRLTPAFFFQRLDLAARPA